MANWSSAAFSYVRKKPRIFRDATDRYGSVTIRRIRVNPWFLPASLFKMNTGSARDRAGQQGVLPAGAISGAPGVVMIGLNSGRRLRNPLGALGLLGGFGRRGCALRLRRCLLFATMFPLELLPQFALNAGMRRHDLAIRLCQSV